MPDCVRCGSPLEEGFCSDATCPFSDHRQDCQLGWAGHPEKDPHPHEDVPDFTSLQHCDCHDKEYAVVLKYEVVVHATAPSAEEAQDQAKGDEEYLGMLLAKAEPEVVSCEEQ
jgi:hypothetical protein